MRFVVKLTIPPERFNQAVRAGTARQTIERILDETKPEAVYFGADDGDRGGFLIVTMDDASEIPTYAEPWFLQFDAKCEFVPVMTPEDLGAAGLDELGKHWS